jgi:integrase
MALNRLTAMTVAKLSRPGKYPDGGGLYLQITLGADGAPRKSWVHRYTSPETGKERHAGYGAYPEVSLGDARSRRDKGRTMIRDGLDPLVERDRQHGKAAVASATAMTFDQCAAGYIAAHAPSWGARKHRVGWENSLARYASPVFGGMPVDTVDVGLVLRVIEPLWQHKPFLASRLRGRIEAVLSWAIARQLRPGPNPAQWKANLDVVLPSIRKFHKTVHHKALPYREVPELMERLSFEGTTPARAMSFLILTAARVGEVARATWAEIDLAAQIWTIGGERMKSGRIHRVPLSPPALAILVASAPPRDPSALLFPSKKIGHAMSDLSFSTLLARLDVDATTHGFRSAFADWAYETTEFARELIEASLAHTIGDATERAYRRSDALERRARLINAWGAYCSGEAGGKVVRLRQ